VSRTVGDLTATDIGRLIGVSRLDSKISGVLRRVHHDREDHDVGTVSGGDPIRTLTNPPTTYLVIGPWEATVPSNNEVFEADA
jgi:hypothetical protein